MAEKRPRRRVPVFLGKVGEAQRLQRLLAAAGLGEGLELTGRSRRRTIWCAPALAAATRALLRAHTREPADLVSADEAEYWFCTDCGAEVALGVHYCPACGAFIGDPHAL